jgi:hypothetical protein
MALMAGFCDDIIRHGRTFVVQTEDKGPRQGVIESVVFEGGRVLHVRRTSYLSRLGDPDLEAEVGRLMAEQHRAVRKDVESGRLDGPPAAGGA